MFSRKPTTGLFDPRQVNQAWPEPNVDTNIPYTWGLSGYKSTKAAGTKKSKMGLFDPRQRSQAWPEPNVDTNIPYAWGLSGYRALGFPRSTVIGTRFSEPNSNTQDFYENKNALTPEAFLELLTAGSVPLKLVDGALAIDATNNPALGELDHGSKPDVVVQTTAEPTKGVETNYAVENSTLAPAAPQEVALETKAVPVSELVPGIYNALWFGATLGTAITIYNVARICLDSKESKTRGIDIMMSGSLFAATSLCAFVATQLANTQATMTIDPKR